MTKRHDLYEKSRFRDKPLETHPFDGDGNAFNCNRCGRPRCFHVVPEPEPVPVLEKEKSNA